MTNLDIVKGVYEAFGRGDIPAVLSLFDPQISWREAESNPYEPSGKPWVGHDELMQKLFMRIGAEWDYFRVVPHTFHDAGDSVIAEVRYGGKYKSTGRTLDAQACHVFTLRNGKVMSFQQYVDTARVQDALGVR